MRAPRALSIFVAVVVVFALTAIVASPAASDEPEVFVVDSTADTPDPSPGDGVCGGVPAPQPSPELAPVPCTLRAAIQEANAHANVGDAYDEIRFAIPADDPGCAGDGVCTIAPATPLPALEEKVSIDGTTQTGWSPNTADPDLGTGFGTNAVLKIVLDGSTAAEATDGAEGLRIAAAGVTVRGLVIGGWEGSGIFVDGSVGAHGTVIAGNFIGTDATGLVALPNAAGITVFDAADTTIGPPAGEQRAQVLHERNLISGNASYGLRFEGASSSNNIARFNIIGLDASGRAPLPNGSGVSILEASGVTLTENTISGNGSPGTGDGVWIVGTEANPVTNTTIEYNFIGTADWSIGEPGTGNGGSGVALGPHVSGTRIGAPPDAGGGNHIFYNGYAGVILLGFEEPADSANTIVDNFIGANAIDSNAALGIDLGQTQGPTENDPLDADAGPNGQQNYPEITSVTVDETTGTTVTGTIETTPNSTVRIELFAVNECDASGFGEGSGYFGEVITDPTDETGHVDWTWQLGGFSGSPFFTATATVAGNTSEFSACHSVPPSPGGGGGVVGPGPGTPPAGTPDAAQTPPAQSPPPGASATPAPERTSQTVAPGGTVTSDSEGDGATASDPVETSVTSPNGGTVTVEETSAITEPEPAGYNFLGQQVNISAPPATPEDPLILVFRLDESLFEGQDPAGITVFREGVPLPGCTGPTGMASPDPCVSGRIVLADGDLELTALTSAASAWNFGVSVEAAAPSTTRAGIPNTAGAAPARDLIVPAGLLLGVSTAMWLATRRLARGRR